MHALSTERVGDTNLEEVAAAPRDVTHDLETFRWRTVDRLWGRKP
jgi:hypothetical protein